MTRSRPSSTCAMARVSLAGAVSLGILAACSSDKTLTTPSAATPIDSLAAKFRPLIGEIAFVSTRDGSPFIYVAAADGSSLRRLAKGDQPTWSSDGRQILFHGMSYDGDTSIHVINADGSDDRVLQPGGGRPDLSPDGSRLAFSTELGMYVANRDGSNPRLLVSSDWQRPGDMVGDAGWSPDGKRIAFVSGDWDVFGFGIYVANVDGSGVVGTALPGYLPRWSPDGSQIAFTTTVSTYFPGNGPHRPSLISVVGAARPDGSGLRLVNNGGLLADEADWSPDGLRLLFVGRNASGQLRIFVTDTAFQATSQLVANAAAPTVPKYDDYGAAWSRAVTP